MARATEAQAGYAVMWAAEHGHAERVATLLADNKGSATWTTWRGASALSMVCYHGSYYASISHTAGVLECVRLLIAAGSPANQVSTSGFTPMLNLCQSMLWAQVEGEDEYVALQIAQLLLSARAEVSVALPQNCSALGRWAGRTPLDFAAKSGCSMLACTLLSAGARSVDMTFELRSSQTIMHARRLLSGSAGVQQQEPRQRPRLCALLSAHAPGMRAVRLPWQKTKELSTRPRELSELSAGELSGRTSGDTTPYLVLL